MDKKSMSSRRPATGITSDNLFLSDVKMNTPFASYNFAFHSFVYRLPAKPRALDSGQLLVGTHAPGQAHFLTAWRPSGAATYPHRGLKTLWGRVRHAQAGAAGKMAGVVSHFTEAGRRVSPTQRHNAATIKAPGQGRPRETNGFS